MPIRNAAFRGYSMSSLLALRRVVLAPMAGAIVAAGVLCRVGDRRMEVLAAARPPAAAVSTYTYAANEPIEDRLLVQEHADYGVLTAAVFDGHGGWQAAEFCQKNMDNHIVSRLEKRADKRTGKNVASAITAGFLQTETEFVDRLRPAFQVGFGELNHCGACAVAAIVSVDQVVVGNAGDCRCILGTVDGSGTLSAVALTNDHNSKHDLEKARLKAAHPGEQDIVMCKHPNACYVKGRLQPTRSIGDVYLKYAEFNGPNRAERWRGRHIPQPYTPPYITAEPEITIADVKGYTKAFVVLASDGLWDAMTTEEVAEFVHRFDGDQTQVAASLVMQALAKEAQSSRMSVEQLLRVPPGQRRHLHDDVTVVVAFLEQSQQKKPTVTITRL